MSYNIFIPGSKDDPSFQPGMDIQDLIHLKPNVQITWSCRCLLPAGRGENLAALDYWWSSKQYDGRTVVFIM